jgi:fructose-1,6-bisphosphatase II
VIDVTANPTIVLGARCFPPELVSAVCDATEAAAAASRAWFGRGDKNAADQAAVEAMRAVLASAPFDGTVIIGEGEKDDAPMLANGERLGLYANGEGLAVDIAVDPLDGTSLAAAGIPGSICVIALAPAGTMFAPTDAFYMEKLICGPAGIGVVDLRKPVGENLVALAAAQQIDIHELEVTVLDKPRHERLRAEVVASGARLRLVGEGDISVAVEAVTLGGIVLGVGGTPEGVIAACAVRALGGFMQGRLAPQSAAERGKASVLHDLDRILELDDLVRSDRVLFVSTAL